MKVSMNSKELGKLGIFEDHLKTGRHNNLYFLS